MPNEQPKSGDWEDFIEREEKGANGSRDSGFNSEDAGAEQGGSGKESEEKRAEQDGEDKETVEGGGEENDRENGTDFEKKFSELKEKLEKELLSQREEFKKQLDEKEKLYQEVLERLNGNDPEMKKRAEEIKSEAERALNEEAPSKTDPWGITAESIDPERLKILYGGGLKDFIMDKLRPEAARRGRIKKAEAEFKEIKGSREREIAFQDKKKEKIDKINPKKDKMEKKVDASKLKLEAERARKVTPAQERYDHLRSRLEALNEKKYSFFKEPIAKISNSVKKRRMEGKVGKAEWQLEDAKRMLKPKEAKHQKLVDQLNETNSNIDNLKKEISRSEKICKGLEERILRIAGIDSVSEKEKAKSQTEEESSKTQESRQKHSAAGEETGENKETGEDELKEGKFLRELVALRGIKNIKELENKVRDINDKYGHAFNEYGEYLVSEHRHPYTTQKGETVLLKAFKSGDQFKIIIKKIEKNKKEYKKAA